jgi:hypothetical protein
VFRDLANATIKRHPPHACHWTPKQSPPNPKGGEIQQVTALRRFPAAAPGWSLWSVGKLDTEDDSNHKHGENNEEDERVSFGASPPRRSRQNKEKTAKTKEK